MVKQRPTTPRSIDEKRIQRATALSSTGREAGNGISVDAAGRFYADLGAAMQYDDRGRITPRVGGDLAILSGSPEAIVFRPSSKTKRGIVESAVPNIIEVEKGPERLAAVDARVTGLLLNHETRIANLEIDSAADGLLIADHTGRIGSLETEQWIVETGEDAFTIGGTTTVPCAIVHSDATYCVIKIMRTGFNGAAGHWYIDNIADDSSFDITSDGASDKGPFRWWVMRKAGY